VSHLAQRTRRGSEGHRDGPARRARRLPDGEIRWGFPHTTGTVIVQQVTGSYGGELFTLMGSDARTPLGAGNLGTVAGGLAKRTTLGGPSGHGMFDRISLSFGPPVPSLSPAAVAAASALILLAAGYALRRRRA
jgi:hypothetical protein